MREPTPRKGVHLLTEVVMRADMGKVLVERPRPGSRDGSKPQKGYRRRLQKALDEGDAPAREGMKKRCGGSRPFNEHLAPLRRFLNSNVGRPWDKIYGEICAHVDRGTVVQKHILTHIFDYVITIVILIDGKPCNGEPGHWYGDPLRESDRRHQWYVCPKSGLLRRSRYVPRRRRKHILARHVTLDDTRVCLELGGQWELVTVAPLPPPGSDGKKFDIVLKRTVYSSSSSSGDTARQLYGATVYATERRLLSRAELRSLPIPFEWLEKPVRGQLPRHN